MSFHNIIQNKIKELIENRITDLKKKISDLENIDYKELLDNETNNVLNIIKDNYLNNINELYNNLENEFNIFNQERLNEFLKNNNYNKFINRLKVEFKNMDFILYNNYLESYHKYLELNKKVAN